MSAFMHTDKSFDDVAATMARHLYNHDYSKKAFSQKSVDIIRQHIDMPVKVLERLTDENDKAEWFIKRFCEALHKANQKSVDARYGSNSKEYFGGYLNRKIRMFNCFWQG